MPAIDRLRSRFASVAGGLPRPFWVLWGGMFVNRAGGFVLPFMAIYLTQARHLSFSQAGLVVALYGAGGAIAGPVGGYLADHVGRRFTMLLALLAGGSGMIAIGFLDRIEHIAPAMFCVALLNEMYRPSMQAAIADLVPAEARMRAFGLLYWVINLGFSFGLALGGLLATRSFRWLFVGDGLTTLLFALLVATGVPETRPAPAVLAAGERPRSAFAAFTAPFREGPFLAFLGLTFLFALVFMQNSVTFPLDLAAHGVGTAAYGVIIALNGVLIVLLQPWMAPALSRFNRSHTLAVSTALAGVGFGLNAIVHTAPLYALGVIIWTVAEIGVLPVANTVVADLAPSDLRGRYQGAYGFAFGLAVCVAPALGTIVLQRVGSATLWTGCLGLGLLIGAGHMALGPTITRLRHQRIAAAAPPPR
jgi:MFS family permease